MSLRKLVTIILCGIILELSLVGSSSDNDDLLDFDFDSPDGEKHYDYYEESTEAGDKLDAVEDLNDEEPQEEKHQNLFNVKEKALRTALAKALTNKVLRQKFVEVTPILRVMSSQQRLALSALISAQISAKPGTELKLDQVKHMFGDYKKLIIPIVFDIANLVRNAAKLSLPQLHQVYKNPPKSSDSLDLLTRRNFDVTPQEENGAKPGQTFDPKIINEQLYREGRNDNINFKTNETSNSRAKRSASFVYSRKESEVPMTMQRRMFSSPDNRTFHERKLNMTNYVGSNDQISMSSEKTKNYDFLNSAEVLDLPYEQIENLALSDLNETQQIRSNATGTEELPIPESLIGLRQRATANKLGSGPRKPALKRGPPPRQWTAPTTILKKCERFTASMCIRSEDYPMDQIMGSIRRHKHAMSALLAEYRDKSAELEYEEYLEDLELSKKRREDDNEVTPGGMCSSVVRYARPQKARSASGEWKYIVNTGQHTQTLRLEKCSNAQESCSYLSENYRSRCLQVYNYHRLLSWDKNRGLHVDIFKVPTCCSCHVDGYRETFPPLGGSQSRIKTKIIKPNHYNPLPNDEEFEDDEDDDNDSVAYQFADGFKRVKPVKYDSSELLLSGSSKKNRLETPKNSPGLGSYLSPPGSEFDPSQFSFKRGPNLSPGLTGNSFLNTVKNSRRPLGSLLDNEDFNDQDPSGSELGKEVTVFPPIDKSTLRPKRKRISSVSTAIPKKTTTTQTPPPTTTKSPFTIKKNIHNPKHSNTKSDVNKRINYNYHPIIDFFEDHNLSPASSTAQEKKQKRFGSTSSVKDSRIGLSELDNNWRPMIVE